MKITIENLDTKARTEKEGLVLGSKLPHASIEFHFDDDRKTICLDDWVNRKSDAKALREAINSTTIKADNAQRAVEAWDCTAPLFAKIFGFLCKDSYKAFSKPDKDGAYTFGKTEALDTAQKKLMFMFFAAGAAACYWRQNTANALDVTHVEFHHPGNANAESHRHEFAWESLLYRARRWVKANYETVPPENYTRNAEELDSTLLDLLLTENGFWVLCRTEMIQRKGSGGYQFSATERRFLGSSKQLSKGVEQSIRAALNHMRFVIYIEWRMIHELVKKNA